MKMGITGFAGGLLVACERKRGVENDSKVFSLSNWEIKTGKEGVGTVLVMRSLV